MVNPRILVTGGFNLKRYDRELRGPFPSEPQFAADSPVWIREHALTGFMFRGLEEVRMQR